MKYYHEFKVEGVLLWNITGNIKTGKTGPSEVINAYHQKS